MVVGGGGVGVFLGIHGVEFGFSRWWSDSLALIAAERKAVVEICLTGAALEWIIENG